MINLFNYFTKHIVVRFVIAGGSSAAFNLGLLFILHHIVGMYYLLSTTIAFLAAAFVSFMLHRMWTFKNRDRERYWQAVKYISTLLFGLLLNTVFMYVFVDRLKIIVMISQVFTGVIVACSNFFLSRNFVFKDKQKDVLEADNQIL